PLKSSTLSLHDALPISEQSAFNKSSTVQHTIKTIHVRRSPTALSNGVNQRRSQLLKMGSLNGGSSPAKTKEVKERRLSMEEQFVDRKSTRLNSSHRTIS